MAGKIGMIVVRSLILIFLITSCTDHDSKPTKSLKEQDPTCAKLPCWAGIYPGSTTVDEAHVLLEERYGRENVAADQIGTTFGDIVWEDKHLADNSERGYIVTNTQEIVGRVSVYFSREQLTVEQLIAQIGEPTSVIVVMAFSSEVPCAGAYMRFPDSGVTAYLYPRDLFVGVEPPQGIGELELSPPQPEYTGILLDAARVEWQGYVDYCELTFGNEGN